jgi:hypothetical protein
MSPFGGEQRERVRHLREGQHRVDVVLADRARRHAGVSRLRRILGEGYSAGLPDGDQAAHAIAPASGQQHAHHSLGPKACAANSNRGSTAGRVRCRLGPASSRKQAGSMRREPRGITHEACERWRRPDSDLGASRRSVIDTTGVHIRIARTVRGAVRSTGCRTVARSRPDTGTRYVGTAWPVLLRRFARVGAVSGHPSALMGSSRVPGGAGERTGRCRAGQPRPVLLDT